MNQISELRAARLSRQISANKLAKVLGVHPATLSRIERGLQVPSEQLAARIFEYFDGEIPIECTTRKYHKYTIGGH